MIYDFSLKNVAHGYKQMLKIWEKIGFGTLLNSLHFQCDTFFQHRLNFTFSSFNKPPPPKKNNTTYF